MGDGGLAVAQVRGDRNQPRRIDETPGTFLAAADFEAEHGTKALLLTPGQFMLGVAGKPGVIHPLDTRLLLQPFGQRLRARAMGLHTQAQRFQPLEKEPGIEGAQRRATGAQEAHHFLHLLGTTGNHAPQAPSLPVDELGCRMDHDIRTHRQRLLQHGRAEAVIHRQQRPLGLAQLRQFGDVHQLGQGVGG